MRLHPPRIRVAHLRAELRESTVKPRQYGAAHRIRPRNAVVGTGGSDRFHPPAAPFDLDGERKDKGACVRLALPTFIQQPAAVMWQGSASLLQPFMRGVATPMRHGGPPMECGTRNGVQIPSGTSTHTVPPSCWCQLWCQLALRRHAARARCVAPLRASDRVPRGRNARSSAVVVCPISSPMRLVHALDAEARREGVT